MNEVLPIEDNKLDMYKGGFLLGMDDVLQGVCFQGGKH
jgi:hypothetical protein